MTAFLSGVAFTIIVLVVVAGVAFILFIGEVFHK